MPLPIRANEVLLLAGDVLMTTGAVRPRVFLPAAALAMAAGMLTVYSWARILGGAGLHALADRIGAAAALERTARRLRAELWEAACAAPPTRCSPATPPSSRAARCSRRRRRCGAACRAVS
jgi:hypothetical protein